MIKLTFGQPHKFELKPAGEDLVSGAAWWQKEQETVANAIGSFMTVETFG